MALTAGKEGGQSRPAARSSNTRPSPHQRPAPRPRRFKEAVALGALLAAAIVAPALLAYQSASADVDALWGNRNYVVLEGEVGSHRTLQHPESVGGSDVVWSFTISRVTESQDPNPPSPGDEIEILVADDADGSEEFAAGRKVTVLVQGAERHDPNTSIGYWNGWNLEDARTGSLWTPQQQLLGLAAGLAAASLAAAGALAWCMARMPKNPWPAVATAGLGGLALGTAAALWWIAGHGAQPSTKLAALFVIIVGAAALAAAPWLAARATAVAFAMMSLATPWLAMAIQQDWNLTWPNWRAASYLAIAAAVAVALLLPLQKRWHAAVPLAVALGLAIAAIVSVVTGAAGGSVTVLDAWGPLTLAAVAFAAAGIRRWFDSSARRKAPLFQAP